MSCKRLGSKLRQLHQKKSGRGFKSDQSRSSKLVYPPQDPHFSLLKDYNHIYFHRFVELSFHNGSMLVVGSDLTDFYLRGLHITVSHHNLVGLGYCVYKRQRPTVRFLPAFTSRFRSYETRLTVLISPFSLIRTWTLSRFFTTRSSLLRI